MGILYFTLQQLLFPSSAAPPSAGRARAVSPNLRAGPSAAGPRFSLEKLSHQFQNPWGRSLCQRAAKGCDNQQPGFCPAPSSAYLAFSSPSSAPGSVPRSEERKSSWGRLLNPPGPNLSGALLELPGFPQISAIPNSQRRSVGAASATRDFYFLFCWINTSSLSGSRNSPIVSLTGNRRI